MVSTTTKHGMAPARGCSHMRLGNFCSLFEEEQLPSWADDAGVKEQCEAENIAAMIGGSGGLMHDINNSSPDSGLPAGYTFFAQLVDHDITLDTGSGLHKSPEVNLAGAPLANLRSASLDLDCVYGFGPEASPFLYDERQHGRLLTGSVRNDEDVPRNEEGRALIGDPRNDENIFVSQMQLIFLKFHNRRLTGRSFEDAQKDVRYHYQWVVLYDLLARICDAGVYEAAVCKNASSPLYDLRDDCGRVCMPLEFSVAAYRFGHSLVRTQYPVNEKYPVVDLFDERFGTEGFSAVPENLVVDWRYLLPIDSCLAYSCSKSLDHLLTTELIRMPDPVVGRFASENDRSLAYRNILRGYALGLPSGQRVAKALHDKGYTVIDPGQDLEFAKIEGWRCLDKKLASTLSEHTPLFLYLLREAGIVGEGQRLGPVGSAIVLEVFLNMLKRCRSFLHEKDWKPDPCVAQDGHLTLADLAQYAKGHSSMCV